MTAREIGTYSLLDELGRGGLGTVYRARDTRYGRTVALKLRDAASFPDDDARRAFLDDARAAATLSHPNIATLFEVGEHDGGCYLVYEFASGTRLDNETAGRQVNPRRAVEIAVQIADALAEAHAHGILHGDLRPATITLTPKGSVKIHDFGMSRWTDGGAVRRRAASEPDALGPGALPVVAYMSPEQAVGGLVDPRSDLFSLGVILYEMLAGRHPFSRATPADTAVQIATASAAKLSSVIAGVLPELEALVARAISKQIDGRQQSAVALAADLRALSTALDIRSGEAVQVPDLLPLDDDRGGAARYWLAALLLVAVAAVTWWFLGR